MKLPSLALSLKLVIVYMMLLIGVGAYRSHLIIEHLPDSFQETAKISNYISLPIMASSIFMLVAGILGFTWYFMKIHGLVLEVDDYIGSARYLILSLIANELCKVIAIELVLIDEIRMLDLISEKTLQSTLFVRITSILDAIFFSFGSIMLALQLSREYGYPRKTCWFVFIYLLGSISFIYVIFSLP
ncbi:MAG: hypothetical protein K2U26_02645 [Cyclobacteriaceae bacterium]|nr:hypothetical protein [Cyclobacteriaceae bacterium]